MRSISGDMERGAKCPWVVTYTGINEPFNELCYTLLKSFVGSVHVRYPTDHPISLLFWKCLCDRADTAAFSCGAGTGVCRGDSLFRRVAYAYYYLLHLCGLYRVRTAQCQLCRVSYARLIQPDGGQAAA